MVVPIRPPVGPRRTGLALPPLAGLALAAVALALGGACGGEQRPADLWRLQDRLLRSARVEILLPEIEPPESTEHSAWPRPVGLLRAELAAAALAARGDFGVEVLDAGHSEDRGAARVALGTATTPGLAVLCAPLVASGALQLGDDGPRFAGRALEGAGDVLVATYEDPERPGLPLTVVLGHRAADAVALLADLTPSARPGFRCWLGGDLEVVGELTPDGWIVPGSTREPGALRRELIAGHVRVGDRGLLLHVPRDWDRERHLDYLDQAKRARSKVLRLVGEKGDSGHPVVLRWFDDPQEFARVNGGWSSWRVDPLSCAVDVVVSDRVPHDGGFGAARATALACAGPPKHAWLLDGIAAHAAGSFWGLKTERWVSFLHENELTPPPRALLREDSDLSPLLLVPMRGMLLRYLSFLRGDDFVRELWAGRRTLTANPRLAEGFLQWLDELSALYGAGLDAARTRRHRAVTLGPPRRGVGVAGGAARDVDRGYGTRAGREVLAAAAGLGANAFSLTVLDYAVRGLPDHTGGSRDPRLRSSCADLAIHAAVHDGRELGMAATLRPHTLTERSGSWTGRHALNSREDWDRFFADTGRALVHYGLLAELSGCEILVLGNGGPLATFTKLREGQELHHDLYGYKLERWKEVVAQARAAFSGGLTYAADWLNQAAELEFWSELDFVAGDLWIDLPDPAEVEDRPVEKAWSESLQAALRRLLAIGRQHGKPVLVTEIGFPATARAWDEPSRARGRPDDREQERLLECLAGTLPRIAGRYQHLAGVFVWSWGAQGSGAERDPFALRGRPAERALARLFADL